MSLGEAGAHSRMPPKTIRVYEEIGLIGPVERLALHHVADIHRWIAERPALRGTVAVLLHRCHGDDRAEWPILDELEAHTPRASARDKSL